MAISEKLIERYAELEKEAPDCLLLMQVGIFLQVLDDDARAVSEVTGLKLQMAGSVDRPVVIGGFPTYGLDTYVGKLVRAGHSVAVAVQGVDGERRIEGRGTHRAVERLRTFTRRATQNGTRRAWYLQLDLGGFFVGIELGRFWEISAPTSGPAEGEARPRAPEKERRELAQELWLGSESVAWIRETGRRLSGIAERTLVRRWPEPSGPSPSPEIAA